MGEVFKVGDQIYLRCLGATPNQNQVFLNGNTSNGAVTLVKTTDHPFSGALWEVVWFDGNEIGFVCKGNSENPDHVFLDGRTIDGSVGLASSPFTATHWKAIRHRNILGIPDGTYSFKCLGLISNPDHVFLDGRTIDGSVGLASNTNPPLCGTHWEATVVVPAPAVRPPA